jgi:hypothetical protein
MGPRGEKMKAEGRDKSKSYRGLQETQEALGMKQKLSAAGMEKAMSRRRHAQDKTGRSAVLSNKLP